MLYNPKSDLALYKEWHTTVVLSDRCYIRNNPFRIIIDFTEHRVSSNGHWKSSNYFNIS